MFKYTHIRAASVLVMLFLVFVLIAAPFNAPAQADPVSLIIALVVGAATVVVVDYFVCGFDIFFYCDRNGNIIGSVGNGNGTGGTDFVPINGNNGTNGNNNGNGNNGNNGNGNAIACLSTEVNACGMRGNGFIINNACNATPPPNSSCPAPVIGDKGFYADPASVRTGEKSKLFWNVTNATTCDLTGGGLTGQLGIAIKNLLGLGTNTINSKTVFTLTCQNGLGGPKTSKQTTVNLIPSYQEV
ncbi:MAG TPA: hypothetical protein VHD31_00080 [Candidatus Paceibacterota bacterium]|nr:hypothetical protein [Candidatus Paceibacterota bacterium]